jgi:hypothetical protein
MPAPAMNMHTLSHTNATRWHPTPPTFSNPLRTAHDAPSAAKPAGLSQDELRRIILDLIG